MIKLDKEIIKFGVDLDLIREIHSKTKLGTLEIESVSFIRYVSNDIILIRLGLVWKRQNRNDH